MVHNSLMSKLNIVIYMNFLPTSCQRIGLWLSQICLNICSCLHTCGKVTEVNLLKYKSTVSWHSMYYHMNFGANSHIVLLVVFSPHCVQSASRLERDLPSFSTHNFLYINSMARIVRAPSVGMGPIWHLCFMYYTMSQGHTVSLEAPCSNYYSAKQLCFSKDQRPKDFFFTPRINSHPYDLLTILITDQQRTLNRLFSFP